MKFPRFVSNIENCRKQEKLMTADIVIPVYRPGAELGELLSRLAAPERYWQGRSF